MGYPIVPVMKQDGRVRVCGDYKLTVNKVSKLDAYPIPNLCSDFLRNYYESTPTKVFTDTTVSPSAKPHHLLISASNGATSYWYSTGEVLLDNVLITYITEEEHLSNPEVLLKCLSDAGLRLKVSKCQSMKPFWIAWVATTIKMVSI